MYSPEWQWLDHGAFGGSTNSGGCGCGTRIGHGDLFKRIGGTARPKDTFKPELSQIKAQYLSWSTGPSSFGGEAGTNFRGVVTLYDRHGKVISLYSQVSASYYDDGHMAVFFAMSKEARPSVLWSQLDAIRDGFQYRR